MMAGRTGTQSSISERTESEQSAKRPTGEGLNCSAAVHAEMVMGELHLAPAMATSRTVAAAREP